MRNKLLLSSTGLALSLISFIGCGGSNTESANNPYISTPVFPKKIPDAETNILTGIDPLPAFQTIIANSTPIQSNKILYKQTENKIAQNQLVDLKLEYTNSSPSLYHAMLKLGNQFIGENYIFMDSTLSNEPIELLFRLADNTQNKYTWKHFRGFSSIWEKDTDYSIILDSLKNNLFNTSQNNQYTVSFSLQKTTEDNYQLSNIQVSGLNLTQNSFLITKDKLKDNSGFGYLQSTLTTLFANFEKSKEIFN